MVVEWCVSLECERLKARAKERESSTPSSFPSDQKFRSVEFATI
jgi:hypothetical protein